ncbi:GtrA family protein [Lactobacillus sp. ESL0791]|nr:GtrA family protein [Lactobacillus sp. ESL0791]
MINLIKKYWQIFSYLLSGGLTTLINLLVFNYLYTWQHLIGYQLATFIAWLLSVIFAYVTNKLYVFDSHQKTSKDVWKEAGSFFFWRILSLLMDFAILKVGIGIMHKNAFWVKLIDNVIVVIANYLFSKIFIFKSKSSNK